eukprot:scaffold29514_cov143-Isochrysis_galbana.AAC.1
MDRAPIFSAGCAEERGQNSLRSAGHAYVSRPRGQIEAAEPHTPAASREAVPRWPADGRAPTVGGSESSRRRKKSSASGSAYVPGSSRSGRGVHLAAVVSPSPRYRKRPV